MHTSMDTATSRLRGTRTAAAILVGLTSAMVVGCATLNETECTQGDWQQIGYSDGNSGLDSADRLARHAKACQKHGVSLDTSLYQSGYADGVSNYCQPENGFKVGRAGSAYKGVCPLAMESEFLVDYVSGLEDKLDSLEDEEDRMRDDLEDDRDSYAALQEAGVVGKSLEKAKDRVASTRSSLSTIRTKKSSIRSWISKWSREI